MQVRERGNSRAGEGLRVAGVTLDAVRFVRSDALVAGVLVAVLGGITAGCGGAAPAAVPACVVPRDADGARAALQGRWRISGPGEREEGEVRFDGGRVEARTSSSVYAGTWRILVTQGNAHRVELVFDRATEQVGVTGRADSLFAQPTRVVLDVVFVDGGHAMAFQIDGAWAQWSRVFPEDSSPVTP